MEKNTKVGDKIRITNADSITGGRYKNGDILTVDSVSNRAVTVEEHNVIIFHEEYEVLGKMPKVGDKIRVVAAENTGGLYKDGDILTVKGVSTAISPHVSVEEFRRPLFFREFEIIEEPEQLPKVGDIVEVVKPDMPAGRYDVGDILTVRRAPMSSSPGRRLIEVEEHDQPLYVEEVKVVGRKTSVYSASNEEIMPNSSPEVEALTARVNAVEASMSHLDALISQKADKHEQGAERDIQAEINDIEAYLARKYPGADVTVKVDIEIEGARSRTRF